MPTLPLPPVRLDASPARELPAPVRRRLRARGTDLDLRPDEDLETLRARLETDLLALFRDERNAADFDALYAFAGPTLAHSIARQLRGGATRLDAVDLVQDTFVNVYRYVGSFRDERARSFRVWVGAIARNLVRRRMSEQRTASLNAFPDDFQDPVDLRPGPVRALQSVEEQRAIRGAWLIFLGHYTAAFAQLGERDRRALELVELEERSYKECCEILGVGMSNMKMIMFRARKRIRARMAASMGIDVDDVPPVARLSRAG